MPQSTARLCSVWHLRHGAGLQQTRRVTNACSGLYLTGLDAEVSQQHICQIQTLGSQVMNMN